MYNTSRNLSLFINLVIRSSGNSTSSVLGGRLRRSCLDFGLLGRETPARADHRLWPQARLAAEPHDFLEYRRGTRMAPCHCLVVEPTDQPFRRVEEQIVRKSRLIPVVVFLTISPYLQTAGVAVPCLARNMLEAHHEGPAGNRLVQKGICDQACALPYSRVPPWWCCCTDDPSVIDTAALGTTQNVFRRLLFNLVVHPEMQERVQMEIDSVTEGRRLPTFEE